MEMNPPNLGPLPAANHAPVPPTENAAIQIFEPPLHLPDVLNVVLERQRHEDYALDSEFRRRLLDLERDTERGAPMPRRKGKSYLFEQAETNDKLLEAEASWAKLMGALDALQVDKDICRCQRSSRRKPVAIELNGAALLEKQPQNDPGKS
jgi:hypothetical protein